MRRLFGLEGQGSPIILLGFVILQEPSPTQLVARRNAEVPDEQMPTAGAASPLSMQPPVKVPYSEYIIDDTTPPIPHLSCNGSPLVATPTRH